MEEKLSVAEELFAEVEKMLPGMLYTSETDAPLLPVLIKSGSHGSRDAILTAGLADASERSEERSFETLFARLTRVYEGANEVAAESAARYKALGILLTRNLSSLTVLRFGKIRIRVFVVGIDRAGNVVGFQTEAVET